MIECCFMGFYTAVCGGGSGTVGGYTTWSVGEVIRGAVIVTG